MKNLLIAIVLCLVISSCEKEVIEKPKQEIKQNIYHNIQVSYDDKKWNNYILEETKILSFQNTYKGVFYIWVKDEKYVIKDTFKYYGNPKIIYYDNGVLKIKE